MLKTLGRWLKIYENEIGLFLWVAALLFLVRSSGILLNNYAETAFLKRYGVEYLPIVNMINAVATFFIMAVMTAVMGRLPGARLLSYLFVFCGGTVAGIRLLIPLGIDLIYPVLFMLKAQYEVLLALLFWNLANDLFNTRQSKRLFPLITAGGVVGQILGAFGTPFMARILSFDNLLFAYLGTTLLGAAVVKGLSANYPSLVFTEKRTRKAKIRTPMTEQFKKILPLLKESTLLKILLVLTFIPNVVIPIMNYQFNFAINEQFATESGMLSFFAYFRGFLNIINLVILLFVGRIYGRWGLPVALMFHPFNYVIAFLAFLFRFDVFSAMYARMSTNVIRTTINAPANAVLTGLFPETYRALVRPFLRGTVVRIGLFLGSGLILASVPLFHPRYLSLVALPFVAAWVFAPFVLKRVYSKILVNLVSGNMLDLKGMEEKDLGQIFRDTTMRSHLTQAFLSSRGQDALWYARLMRSLSPKDLDAHILTLVGDQDDKTKIGLLEMLSPRAGPSTVGVLRDLTDPDNPDLMVAVIRTANRLDPETSSEFDRTPFIDSPFPGVRAAALTGLLRHSPDRYGKLIDAWLVSEDPSERAAGVIAAGESGDPAYTDRLTDLLGQKDQEPFLPALVKSLSRLGAPGLNELVAPYLVHELEPIRLAALDAWEIRDDDTLRETIPLLGDASEEVHELVKRKIEDAPYHNGQLLIESLRLPRRRVREGLFALLESLGIKDLDVFRFGRSRIEAGYTYLAEAEAVRRLADSPERELLIDHLNQKKDLQLENLLHVLAVQDDSGQMRIIFRGIFSSDSRQRANGLEALDDVMDDSLTKIIIPLLESPSPSQTLAVGMRNFQLPRPDSNRAALFSRLLGAGDWVTVVLTLGLLQASKEKDIDGGRLSELAASENPYVRVMAQRILNSVAGHATTEEKAMETEITLPDKILLLKGIEIFEGLTVGELAAVASVTEEAGFPEGEIVIREGESGETLYLIIKGEVSIIKGRGESGEFELDRTGGGDYFGEMALFEDVPRSATVLTLKPSRFLVLHKQAFKEIVREYPQIALHICKVLGGRIRKLHEKITI